MSKTPDDCQKVSVEFQKRVIEIISEEDCSNAEFAKRAGVNKNVVSNITNYGIIPSVGSLLKIADYLDVSLVYLLGKVDESTFIKSETPSSFHERLLQLKDEQNLSFADITNQGSFARNSIHVWVKRQNLPTLDYLFQLAKIFKVSPDYLLGRTDYRE